MYQHPSQRFIQHVTDVILYISTRPSQRFIQHVTDVILYILTRPSQRFIQHVTDVILYVSTSVSTFHTTCNWRYSICINNQQTITMKCWTFVIDLF
jgi:hypothetical protein